MNDESSDFDVLIVGGGLVGASLAIALDGSGLRVAQVEAVAAQPDPRANPDERSLALARASVNALDALGVWPLLEAKTTPIRRVHVSRRGEFGAVRLAAAEHGLAAFGATCPARELGNGLLARLERCTNLARFAPAKLTGFADAGGVMVATLACADGERRLRTRLLVGADGSASFVRGALGIDTDDVDYAQTAFVATVQPERALDGCAYERFTATGPVALLPLAERRAGVVMTVPTPDAARVAALDDAGFLAELHERFGYRLGKFSRPGKRVSYPLARVVARRVIAPRAVLVGNAAQTIHPIGAQGFNLGLRDALTLAELLVAQARAHGDAGDAALLRRYVELRREDREGTAAMSDGLARWTANEALPLKALRSLGLLAIDRVAPLKQALIARGMGFRGHAPALALSKAISPARSWRGRGLGEGALAASERNHDQEIPSPEPSPPNDAAVRGRGSDRLRRGIRDVAIVGAGMVGAALALDLARRGFEVALVESRAPALWRAEDEVDLRVVALAASSIALLERLDVWTSISSARASAYRRMRVWDALAPGALAFDAADEGAAALGYIVENRLIQSALWQAIERQPGIELRCPARVVATEIVSGGAGESRTANPESRLLSFDDGSQLKARLVVAADGADSALRHLLGIETQDRDYAQRGIVAHVAHERAHEATAWQRFLPGATLAFLPLADGRSSIVWSAPNDEAERLLALDDAAFLAELGAAFDFRLGAITAATPRAAFPLRLRLAERYVAPRFALVGDAAHVVHPLAGQGVNLGFRDAAELADVLEQARNRKLADTRESFASEQVLRRYERSRRSDNAISARAFDAIQRGFGSDAGAIAAVRGAGLALVDRVAPLKHFFARRAAG